MKVHKWSEIVREMSPEQRAHLAAQVQVEMLSVGAPIKNLVTDKRELREVRRGLRRLLKAIPVVEKAGPVAVSLRMAISKVNELVL